MPKRRFQVGDRVVYHDRVAGNADLDGRHGTVIYVDGTRCPYTVERDEPYPEGLTDFRARENGIDPKHGHSWFCREENLRKEYTRK